MTIKPPRSVYHFKFSFGRDSKTRILRIIRFWRSSTPFGKYCILEPQSKFSWFKNPLDISFWNLRTLWFWASRRTKFLKREELVGQTQSMHSAIISSERVLSGVQHRHMIPILLCSIYTWSLDYVMITILICTDS